MNRQQTKRIKQIRYLEKEVKKNVSWKYRRRWVWIKDILEVTDQLLVNKHTDELTKEFLIRFYVKVQQSEKEMKSNVMPLKAFKVLLRPIKITLKKLR